MLATLRRPSADSLRELLNKRLNSQIYIENQHLSKCRVRYFGLAFEMVKCRNTAVSHYLPAPESRGCISLPARSKFMMF